MAVGHMNTLDQDLACSPTMDIYDKEFWNDLLREHLLWKKDTFICFTWGVELGSEYVTQTQRGLVQVLKNVELSRKCLVACVTVCEIYKIISLWLLLPRTIMHFLPDMLNCASDTQTTQPKWLACDLFWLSSPYYDITSLTWSKKGLCRILPIKNRAMISSCQYLLVSKQNTVSIICLNLAKIVHKAQRRKTICSFFLN